MVWGSYSGSDGAYAVMLQRLAGNGLVDPSFRIPDFRPPETNSYVAFSSIQVLAGDRVLVSGQFSLEESGRRHSNMVVLAPDGQADPAFRFAAPAGRPISAPLVYPDGRILVAVTTQEGGLPKSDLYRLLPDGSRDDSFHFDEFALPWTFPKLLLPDGKILATRSVDLVSTADNPVIVRLAPDGSRDPSFNIPEFSSEPTPAGFQRGVWITDMAARPDSTLLVGGQFDFVAGLSRHGIARLLPNGDLDAGFRAELPPVVENQVEYWPALDQFVKVGEDSILAKIGYQATTTTERYQFWRLEEYQFNSTNAVPAIHLSAVRTNSVSEAAGEMVFDLYRTGSAAEAASVGYETRAGTASAPQDYPAQAGEIQFAAGERHKQIRVSIVSDALVEPEETLQLVLSGPTGATLTAPAIADGLILNDDSGVEFERVAYRFNEAEAVAVLTVRRTGTQALPCTVEYATRDASAKAGEDYVSHGGVISFSYGPDLSAPIYIQLLDDAVAKGDRTFEVVLSNPTGGAVLDRQALAAVAISDNDSPGRPGLGVDGTINSLAVEQNGHILLAGQFARMNGVPRVSVARLQPDLTLDPTFDARLDVGTKIERVAAQTDRKVLVTGRFTNLHGIARAQLVRFHADGQVDSSFAVPVFRPADGPDASWVSPLVRSIVPLPNGQMLIGGTFTSVNGVIRVGIARLNEDGSVDPRFTHGTVLHEPAVATAYALDLAPLPDGKILLGGRGNTLRDVFHNTVLRLEPDGGFDPDFVSDLRRTFMWGGDIPFAVRSLLIMRNGQILVLHLRDESSYDPPLVLLNPDGSEDAVFASNLAKAVGSPWQGWSTYLPTGGNTVLEAPDGFIWLGGRERLVRIGADGSFDHAAAVRLTAKLAPRRVFYEALPTSDGVIRTALLEPVEITALALKQDGRILIAGSFGAYDGLPAAGLVEVDLAGVRSDLIRIEGLTLVQNGAAGVQLRVRVPAGRAYRLERSSNLEVWDLVVSGTASDGVFDLVDPAPADAESRYYRLRPE